MEKNNLKNLKKAPKTFQTQNYLEIYYVRRINAILYLYHARCVVKVTPRGAVF